MYVLLHHNNMMRTFMCHTFQINKITSPRNLPFKYILPHEKMRYRETPPYCTYLPAWLATLTIVPTSLASRRGNTAYVIEMSKQEVYRRIQQLKIPLLYEWCHGSL